MPVSDSADYIDRLREAIEAHEIFVAEGGSRSASDFLAEHETLRDLLEPLLANAPRQPHPNPTNARVLGDFRLLRELGRGGMGIVYDAEQISLGRRVAVKVLPGRLALDPDRRARFARESRLAASLDHPGIAKVISADADDDAVWFAMERIDGAPLDRVLGRSASTDVTQMTGGLLESLVDDVARQCGAAPDDSAPAGEQGSTTWRAGYVDTVVRIGIQLAAALHHAHQHGVIHRDVKPSNVMLRRDGSAVLTDFGLARDLNEPSLTLTGDFLGTPSYSAPEQLSGDRATVDHRADVFALGVTLYELLTHRRPFEASTSEEVRARILKVEPPRPRRFNSQIPADLSSVLCKALEKDPKQRYQTAAAMADDLRAVAEGRPVRARRMRAPTRTWRWCRRNPWVTTTLASLLTVVLLLLFTVVEANQRHTEQSLSMGVAHARAKDFPRAFAKLMPFARQLPDAATQAALDELFRHFPCLASHALVSEPGEVVSRVLFSSDGRWFCTYHELPGKPLGESARVRIWGVPTPDAPTLRQSWSSVVPRVTVARIVHLGPGPTFAWKTGDRTVFVGGLDHGATLEFDERVLDLVPSSVPRQFGVRFASKVQLYDTGGPVDPSWPAPTTDVKDIRAMAILEGLLVWIIETESNWMLVSAASGANPIEFELDSWSPPRIDLHPTDPTRLLVMTVEGATAWKSERGELHLVGHSKTPIPNQYASFGGSLELVAKGLGMKHLDEFPLHFPAVLGVRVFPVGNGRSLEPCVVAIDDQALRIWGVPGPLKFASGRRGADVARFEPTGRGLLGGGVATLVAWPFNSGGPDAEVAADVLIREPLVRPGMPIFCGITFDPGRAILTCVRDQLGSNPKGRVFVLDVDDPSMATQYSCSSAPCWVELSPDLRQLAVALDSGGVELWNYDSASRELTLSEVLPGFGEDPARLSCVRYLGDDFVLASAGISDRPGAQILCWDLERPDAPPVPLVPGEALEAMRCLAISDDEELVATGGDDQVVRVLRVVHTPAGPTLEPLWEENHSASVFAVAFAEQDGAFILASADRRGEIRLWDGDTGEPRGTLRETSSEPDEMILSLEFSPDDRYLAASQQDGQVLVWDMGRPRRFLEGNRDCAEQLLRLQDQSR